MNITMTSLKATKKTPISILAGLLLISASMIPYDLNASNKGVAEKKVITVQQQNWLEHRVKNGDTLARIYHSYDFSTKRMHQMFAKNKKTRALSKLKIGQTLRFLTGKDGEPQKIELVRSPISRLVVTQTNEGGYRAKELKKSLKTQVGHATGMIRSSLFAAANKAGVTDRQIMKLVKIFESDIDFALQIHEGDTFGLVYEEKYLNGKKYKNGAILAAEFNLHGRLYQAVRFKDKHGDIAYYSPKGKSKDGLFLRTPLNFTRISSHFSKRRWHPKLKRWRAHHGVDYAAPTGTPIRATGSGKISFHGWKGGYGRVLYIKHKGKYTTVYAHMSRYARGTKKGRSVKQGQIIGYVGSSGLATGPHLHYEFRIFNKHKNPEKINFASTRILPKSMLPKFRKETRPLLSQLKRLRTDVISLASR